MIYAFKFSISFNICLKNLIYECYIKSFRHYHYSNIYAFHHKEQFYGPYFPYCLSIRAISVYYLIYYYHV